MNWRRSMESGGSVSSTVSGEDISRVEIRVDGGKIISLNIPISLRELTVLQTSFALEQASAHLTGVPNVTRDAISGFPGEHRDREELMRFVDEMEFDRLGVFAYSEEEDIPRSRMSVTAGGQGRPPH